MAHVFRRARNERDLNLLLRQGLNSWYIYAFQLPWLPEQLWRRATPQLRRRLAKVERLGDGSHWGDTFTRDATNGLDLYRANIQDRMRHPRSGKTGVPVQLIVPSHDKYIVPQVFADLDESVPELTRVDIDAGHWAAVQRPDLVADLVADHVRAHERS